MNFASTINDKSVENTIERNENIDLINPYGQNNNPSLEEIAKNNNIVYENNKSYPCTTYYGRREFKIKKKS